MYYRQIETRTRAALAGLRLRGWRPRLAFAPPDSAPRGDILVYISLRGAADGLSMVGPHGEPAYYRLRPNLALARPDDLRVAQAQRLHDLDGFFGLHPRLAPLLPAWQQGELAVIHACGAPDQSRSHFRAMELLERGIDNTAGPASGWIGRHLAALENGNRSPLRAVALGDRIPRALNGPIPASALRSIADFHLGGDLQRATQLQSALAPLYTGDEVLAADAAATLELLATLERFDPQRYAPAADIRYPDDDFGNGLRQIALLVKAEIGLEVACLDLGGWDTHVAQGAAEGWIAGLLQTLGDGLAALYADLEAYRSRLVIVVLSEFGRRVQENGGLGSDHGHGGVMLLLGGAVQGGRVHGQWPGLETEQLVGPGDLAISTDYRDVLGEIVSRRMNNSRLEQVFPGYHVQFRGLVR